MPRRPNKAVGDSSPQWQWYLLLTVVFVEYTRIFDGLLSFLSPLRIPGLAMLGMLVVFVVNKKDYLGQETLYKLLIAFWLLVCVSVFYAPNNRAAYNVSASLFWYFTGFVFPLVVILCTKERLFRFFNYWVCVQTLLALMVIKGGGHGPGGYLWDENDVALAVNMAVPYVVYLLQFPGIKKSHKVLLYGALAVMLAAVGVSASRGGVVGLAALVVVLVMLSKRPFRNGVMIAAVIMVGLAILLKFLPEAYVEDMQGIDNPEDKTADERLWSWSIGWVMYLENPVAGVGAGNYPWTNHLYAEKSPLYTPRRKILGGRQAHSLYFTLLPELGSIGLLIYVAILKTIYNRYAAVRNYCRSRPVLTEDEQRFQLLFKAMLASGFAFLVSGAFISVLYYPLFWHLVGLVAVTYRLASKEFGGLKVDRRRLRGTNVRQRPIGRPVTGKADSDIVAK